MYIFWNPNPANKIVGDCVIRAISKLSGHDWETTYTYICLHGLMMHDMPSSNRVWEKYLLDDGFVRESIPNTCPECYTVRDFCVEHPYGKYLLAIGNHVVAVENGDYYDTWDSGDEFPIFYWRKEH